jgi:histidinol-phosphate aminotransferase
MTLPAPPLDPKLKKLIRQDVQSMHAYAIQDSAGMVKLDAMENPHRLPAALQAHWASAWARWR